MSQINNIEIHNDLHEDKNNRVLILHQNGEMDVVSSSIEKESYYHMLYFKEYLNGHYLDDEVLQRYKEVSSQPSTIIYLLLSKYGDIVFNETTKDGEENRYGILFLPNNVTEEQFVRMQELKQNYLVDFKELLVKAGYYIDEYNMVNHRGYEHFTGPNYDGIDEFMTKEEKVK